MRALALFLLLFTVRVGQAQVVSNISCTSAEAVAVMKGQHDPSNYAASQVIDDHAEIICALRTAVSADSLKSHLLSITGFGTRHAYSDTVSNTTGIGAARRWAYSRFQAYSDANEGRLIPAYLQFDNTDNLGICGNANGWRNVLAILPGRSVSDHRTVIIEAHLDSRCDDNCDTECPAEGAEDNGSGTALVLELARVMSKYTFDHTLVFMLTTAEEQGLIGARAMAQFCVNESIAIKAVLNNDVIGGVLCGNSSSPPSCPGPGDVDSLNVRIFSNATSAFPHRGLARTIKLYHQEKLQNEVPVHMSIELMNGEDRVGRGGDHIPFREMGFPSIRFTAANEHGDGNTSDSLYSDRQHTSGDILGVDTDGDQLVDSFFVDFNYLQRNAVINGMSATLLALGPGTPTINVLDEPTGLRVQITPLPDATSYRVGVRALSGTNEFIAVYRTTETSFLVPGLSGGSGYYISVAALNSANIMGPFSAEILKLNDADTPPATTDPFPFGLQCAPIGISERPANSMWIDLLPCYPNPTGTSTTFSVDVHPGARHQDASIVLCDALGRDLHRIQVQNGIGKQDLVFNKHLDAGVYPYRLMVDGRVIAVRSLVVL